MLTLSTESSALTPATLRLSVMSSSGFCTSLMALLFMGRAFLNNAPGSLMGGPDISTARSGTTGPAGEAYAAGTSSAGAPASSPTARAKEIAPSFRKREIPFWATNGTKMQHSKMMKLKEFNSQQMF